MLNAKLLRLIVPELAHLSDEELCKLYHERMGGGADYGEFQKQFYAAGQKTQGRSGGRSGRGERGRLDPEIEDVVAANNYGYDEKQGRYYMWTVDQDGKEAFDRSKPLTRQALEVMLGANAALGGGASQAGSFGPGVAGSEQKQAVKSGWQPGVGGAEDIASGIVASEFPELEKAGLMGAAQKEPKARPESEARKPDGAPEYRPVDIGEGKLPDVTDDVAAGLGWIGRKLAPVFETPAGESDPLPEDYTRNFR